MCRSIQYIYYVRTRVTTTEVYTVHANNSPVASGLFTSLPACSCKACEWADRLSLCARSIQPQMNRDLSSTPAETSLEPCQDRYSPTDHSARWFFQNHYISIVNWFTHKFPFIPTSTSLSNT